MQAVELRLSANICTLHIDKLSSLPLINMPSRRLFFASTSTRVILAGEANETEKEEEKQGLTLVINRNES
jgi:hypothetical protein